MKWKNRLIADHTQPILKSIVIDSKTTIFVPLGADEETERQRFHQNQLNKKNKKFIKTGIE